MQTNKQTIKKINIMKTKKRFNYFYNGKPIPKEKFEKSVPKNWMDELDQSGEYSYGYYRASQLNEEE